MAFNLGNIFGGLQDGLKKGLRYDQEYMALMAWAVKTANDDAIKTCGDIAALHASEIAHVLGAGGVGLIFNSDPFAGSRKMVQDAVTKFGAH